jgi:DNA adenine methylase
MISLVSYAGGKGFLVPDILSLYYKDSYKVVVEPFGGSAKFLLNINQFDLFGKKICVYNDRDKRMVDMFTAIRDHPDDLIKRFDMELISRSKYEEYQENGNDDIETGFRELYLLLCGFAGSRDNIGVTKYVESLPNFTRVIENIKTNIYPVIKHWFIENDSYIDIIKRWDSPDTFFYFDPPYMDKNYYRYNFDKNSFRMLRNALKGIKGKYVLNHDASDIVREILGEPIIVKEYTNIINTKAVNDNDGVREEWFYTNLKL